MSVWADWVREGDCIVDVGANTGSYAKAFAEATGPRGVVVAFEPDPVSATACREQCPAWVTVREEIVGERCDPSAAFVLAGARTQHSRFAGCVDHGTVTHLPMTTLDVACVDLPVVGIKIDAQGGDGWVLAGARKTLAAMPSGGWVMVEIWPEGYRAAGYAVGDLQGVFAGWTLAGEGKGYGPAQRSLADALADAETWQNAKHTNLWLRKD